MNHQTLADKFVAAWNRKSVADILKLMDPEASYHDAFWGETCTGRDLVRYFDIFFAEGTSWYEQDGDLISLPNGFVLRYIAYDRQNPKRRKEQYKGAEIMTVDEGVITGISDFYCDPDPQQLAQVASHIESRRSESKIAQLGLSERTAGFIKRQLIELGNNTTVFMDPSVSARHLADRIGCTVAHLMHVLETEEQTSFPEFIRKRRANYAAALLSEAAVGTINLEQIASQSGFKSLEDLDTAFISSFGVGAAAYRAKTELLADDGPQDFPAASGRTGNSRA